MTEVLPPNLKVLPPNLKVLPRQDGGSTSHVGGSTSHLSSSFEGVHQTCLLQMVSLLLIHYLLTRSPFQIVLPCSLISLPLPSRSMVPFPFLSLSPLTFHSSIPSPNLPPLVTFTRTLLPSPLCLLSLRLSPLRLSLLRFHANMYK